MYSAMKSTWSNEESHSISCTGIERIKRIYQICKGIYMIPSLIEKLFGINYKRFESNIVFKSAKTVLHFWSSEKLTELFTFAINSAAEMRNLNYISSVYLQSNTDSMKVFCVRDSVSDQNSKSRRTKMHIILKKILVAIERTTIFV